MTPISIPVQDRLHALIERIHAAERLHSRVPGSVRLLAVSKTRPAEDVASAAAAGQSAFAENYLQEGKDKIAALAKAGYPALEWHFIGSLQGNKLKGIAENFAWVHSVDKEKNARLLSAHRPSHLPPLKVFVQVNISGEASKSGCAPENAEALCRAVTTLPRLELVGLMAISFNTDVFSLQRASFSELRILAERLREQGLPANELSMGMSQDLEAAIAEGSTWVRIGTALFGARGKA